MLHEGMSEWYRIDGGGLYNVGIAFGHPRGREVRVEHLRKKGIAFGMAL